MTELTFPSTHGNHAARLVNASRAEFLPATAPWHPPPRRTGRADRPTPQIGFVSLQTGPMRFAHNSFLHKWLQLFRPPGTLALFRRPDPPPVTAGLSKLALFRDLPCGSPDPAAGPRHIGFVSQTHPSALHRTSPPPGPWSPTPASHSAFRTPHSQGPARQIGFVSRIPPRRRTTPHAMSPPPSAPSRPSLALFHTSVLV